METEIIRGPTKISEVYIRACVRNVGLSPAQNCRLYMTGLDEKRGDHLEKTAFQDARPIAWAGWKFEPRVVPNGVDFYVDVVRVNKAVPGWIFSVELFSSEETLMTYRGIYRFHLLATADNATPVPFSLDVNYEGDWHYFKGLV